MDGSSKILTVSYGTFSCTLEGFDDPLDAMRDIAEYFRDLASDDRYFGAEPPTPDPEMLQAIASREVNRRVEAKVSETGVPLRQVESDVVDTEKDDAADMAARVASKATVEAAPEKPVEADDTAGPLAFDDDYLLSDEPEDVLAVDPDATPKSDGPAESVAEKLRRIRAVVSRNIEPSETSRDFSEDQARVAPEEEAKRDRALTETIEAITADLADDEDAIRPEPAPAEVPEPVAEEKPDPSVDLAPEADAQPVEPRAEPEPVVAKSDDEQFEDDLAEAVEESRPRSMPRDAVEPSAEAPVLEDAFDEVAEDRASDHSVEQDSVSAEKSDDVVEDNVSPMSGYWTSGDDDQVADAEDEPEDDSSEYVEEDVDLASDEKFQRSVSEIIGNVSGRIMETVADAQKASDKDATSDDPARALSPEPEGDVGRLLAETDTKLNDDDVVRRRRVISQMRAAVAATKADRLVSRQVSRETVEEDEQSQYREDLSEVVRDAPPLPKENVGRPKSSAPPLVLVSSQRVDVEKAEATPEPANEAGDFAEFAKTMGATELSDLLEAAAAFTVFSEGQPSFTRPEIMKRVARVDPTMKLSREESLRSFGQLLRQGKFRKLERGQFTIDKDTRFNPKHRIAGE